MKLETRVERLWGQTKCWRGIGSCLEGGTYRKDGPRTEGSLRGRCWWGKFETGHWDTGSGAVRSFHGAGLSPTESWRGEGGGRPGSGGSPVVPLSSPAASPAPVLSLPPSSASRVSRNHSLDRTPPPDADHRITASYIPTRLHRPLHHSPSTSQSFVFLLIISSNTIILQQQISSSYSPMAVWSFGK